MHQHAERLALAILLPEEEIKNVSNRHIAGILNIPLNYVRLRRKHIEEYQNIVKKSQKNEIVGILDNPCF